MSTAAAEYEVRIATAGASVVAGNVDLTLAQADMTATPLPSGPDVSPLKGSSTSSPFRVPCIVDDVLFTSSGRMTVLGRLAEVRRSIDGGAMATLATGRISHVSEPVGRGEIIVEVSDERWVERRSQLFRTTTSIQMHPPGLTAAFMDRPAAGTAVYEVLEVSGDAVRIRPEIEDSLADIEILPIGVSDALVNDLLPGGEREVTATNSTGNFTALRFDLVSGGPTPGDYTIISFSQALQGVILNTAGKFGILRSLSPEGDGVMHNAWIFISGHSLVAGNTITGRFYWQSGVATTEGMPYLVGGVNGIHPMTLLRDTLDGDHGGPVVGYDTTAMNALEALSLRPVWVDERGSVDRAKWLTNIYPLYGIAPLVGTDLQLRPTALRLDQNVDPATLTTLAASDASLPTWHHGSADLVTILALTSRYLRATAVVSDQRQRVVHEYDQIDFPYPEVQHDNVATLGEVVHEIKTSLILDSWDQRSLSYRPVELATGLFEVFGDGPQFGTVSVPDDAGVEVGDQVIIDNDTLKGFNADVAARTGDRVVRLLSFRETSAAVREFDYLDLGPNAAILTAPTVVITQDGTDADLLNVAITNLPAGTTAHVECDTGSGAPSIYRFAKDQVGNETVTFRIPAGSGTGYARAYSTAPGRIRSAWATDTVALSTRAKIDRAFITIFTDYTADVSWDVQSGTLGMKTDYDIHDRLTAPSFGSNIVDYDASDGGFTIPNVPRTQVVSVKLIPYTGWTGAAVSGSAGDEVRVEEFLTKGSGIGIRARAFSVSGVEVTFDANGEAVVSASGDEDTANLYVTVGNGSAPSDPTASTNDGSIVGRTGTASTAIKVTTGNDAIVKVVAADVAGKLGPVTSVTVARRSGPFHKDTTSRSTTAASDVTLETITVPADALGLDGAIRVTAVGRVTGSNGNRTIRIKWNGSVVGDLIIPGSAGSELFWLEAIITNDGGASSQDIFTIGYTGEPQIDIDRAAPSVDTTSDVDIVISGQVVSGDALILETTFAEYLGTD